MLVDIIYNLKNAPFKTTITTSIENVDEKNIPNIELCMKTLVKWSQSGSPDFINEADDWCIQTIESLRKSTDVNLGKQTEVYDITLSLFDAKNTKDFVLDDDDDFASLTDIIKTINKSLILLLKTYVNPQIVGKEYVKIQYDASKTNYYFEHQQELVDAYTETTGEEENNYYEDDVATATAMAKSDYNNYDGGYPYSDDGYYDD